jgi:hypothetical protein
VTSVASVGGAVRRQCLTVSLSNSCSLSCLCVLQVAVDANTCSWCDFNALLFVYSVSYKAEAGNEMWLVLGLGGVQVQECRGAGIYRRHRIAEF